MGLRRLVRDTEGVHVHIMCMHVKNVVIYVCVIF